MMGHAFHLPMTEHTRTSTIWISGVATTANGSRRYKLCMPLVLHPDERLPLLVMLHGCGQDADAFAVSTHMNTVALREHFMVLYPEQDRRANVQGCWNWFDTDNGRAQAEVALIMAAIDQVCAEHPADPARVAIAGMSAGASMAALVATHHPQRFVALGMHSGIATGVAHSSFSAMLALLGQRTPQPLAVTPECMATSWPALLVIHGEADMLVSPRNGQAVAQQWADAAAAEPQPAHTVHHAKRYSMQVTDYTSQGHTVVRLVLVSQLGHAWSGGAGGSPDSDAHGPDASNLLWAFVINAVASASTQTSAVAQASAQ